MIFPGKGNIIFPDNTRKIMLHRDFFKRPSFQNIWKNKIWFFVQWEMSSLVRKCVFYRPELTGNWGPHGTKILSF